MVEYSDISDSEYNDDIERFCSQYDEKEDFKLTKQQERQRFGLPVDNEQIAAIQNSRVPKNMRRCTNCGVSVLDEWGRARNERNEMNVFTFVPRLCSELGVRELSFWLCRFVVEARRQDGTEYPSNSLRVLCSAIQRYLRDECKRVDLCFMDTHAREFMEFHHTLDGVMKSIDRRGIGVIKRQAEPYTDDDENKLWDKVFSIVCYKFV
uniref:Uncharacterized protein LOC102801824 n=1 Tax=Saccoglossus kowalevskii TaxID=10224 RepID=A0ABM0M893_SACKO|nr:PREDICTED: uncharacterized protein LOC102801824 [Saccoglossus kowalevskii]